MFVGRISRNKRINELLNVFAILKERGIDFELRIVGGDWEKILPELQTLAQSLGIQKKVFFLGEISDKKLIEEYGRARFFVSASRYEAFGISTVEAMAAGCVPIVSDIPSFRDFIANTNAGFLVDFTQHSQTADIIEKTLKTDCRPLMKNARLRARDFSWEARIASWKSLYQRVLRK
ncbi:glycosyltransferase [Candidatus Micrarchaeota archaeon]|nr:glycosyltransferase [Candidatus Micrarchaeota archaeon]